MAGDGGRAGGVGGPGDHERGGAPSRDAPSSSRSHFVTVIVTVGDTVLPWAVRNISLPVPVTLSVTV